MTELANADAKTRETKESELKDISNQKRNAIVPKLTATADSLIEDEQFGVVLDSSGKTLNGVPLVLLSNNLPDLTDALISRVAGESR